MTTLGIIDAFTDHPFGGNPATVCLLDQPADGNGMKPIAREMHPSFAAYQACERGGLVNRVFEVIACRDAARR